MLRRKFIQNCAIIAGGIFILKHEAFASIMQQYKIRMLKNDIGIFNEKGGTILFFLGKEGIVVVDAQFKDSAAHLITELKNKGTFSLLINTHHHLDHTSGNIAFKDIVSHILAHENSKKNQIEFNIYNRGEQLYPDKTFSSVWCEKNGNEEICLHYFGAAHTNGDCIVEFKRNKIVHLGDLVFNRKYPYIDKAAGADIANWIKVLDTCIEKFHRKTTFICGHAAEGYDVVINKEDIAKYRDYLRNLLLFVSAEISKNKSRPQILQAIEIPGSPEWKGEGIERSLDAAYSELTKVFD